MRLVKFSKDLLIQSESKIVGDLINFSVKSKFDEEKDDEFLFDSFISQLSPAAQFTLSQMTPDQVDLLMLAQRIGYFRGYDDGVGE